MSNSSRKATYLVVSQGVASVGAALASFGVDVWFYKTTGSYSDFAIIAILATLPPIVISPIAGFLTDRADKSRILYWSELATVLLSILLAFLYAIGHLGFFSIAVCVFLVAVAGEFRYTAMMALIPEVTDKGDVRFINGLQQAFRGIVAVVSPLFGAVGYAYLGLLPLLLISTGAGLFAAYVAYRMVAQAVARDLRKGFTFRSFVDDYSSGLRWLRHQARLKTILILFTFLCGFLAIFRTLLVPHVLDAMGEGWLGVVVSAQGGGLLLAGLCFSRFGKNSRPEELVFLGCYVLGVSLSCFGIFDHPVSLVAMSFLIGASISVVSASNQTIWHLYTPQRMQGKIIAVRSMMLYLFSPVAIHLSVPVSDVLRMSGSVNAADYSDSLQVAFTHNWSGIMLVVAGVLVIASTFVAHMCWAAQSREDSLGT